ncbi:MAG: polysaccharide biosynthesis tyrosine autokinase [Candidatus Cloacimonadota bacterium]|nr:polysaccharide biosynthesis tyrosine autokinase [Candidatus Cloacimonadota bacterium]
MKYYEQQENFTQEEEIKLSDYIRIIRQYIWLIAIIFVVVVSATVLYTLKSPEIFQSTCRILIEEKSGSDMFFAPQVMNNSSINNNIEVLKSRPVMETALKIMKDNPDYKTFPISNPEIEDKVGLLKARIAVESKRETDVLSLSFESTDPKEAMVAANSAAEGLLRHNNAFAKIELTNTREFLGEQLDQFKVRLKESEEELRAFKYENGISVLSEETRQLIERSSEIDAMLEESKTNLIVSTKRLEYLQGQLSVQDSLLQNVNIVLSSPLLEQLRKQIITNQTMLASLLTKSSYNIDHPEIIEIQGELDRSKAKLKEEVNRILKVKIGASDPLAYRSEIIQKIAQTQIDKNVANSRTRSLETIVIENNKKMTLLPDTELELARLERSYRLNEKIHSTLVEKYEDAKIVEQAKIGNVRIIEHAQLPKSPIKPKKSMNLMIGLVLGLGLGVGVAFLIHSLDTKLRTFRDIEINVNVPILGTIPFIDISDSDAEEIEKKMDENGESNISQYHFASRLITHYAPKSPVAEAYRTLRTNLIAKQKKVDGGVSLLITSSGPKEGKSTSISNIGIALSQMDAKVIIVDFDMRKPMIGSMFNLEKEGGVSDFIDDKEKKCDKYIKKTDIKNLDILTSGYLPPNPSEILSSSSIKILIESLKEKYDYVLLDSPPIIAVTDAMILANQVDQMLVVVRVDVTEKEIVKRSLEMLQGVGAEITGVIVNGADIQKYYSGYSYYYYQYYYQQKGKSNKKNGKGNNKKI